MLWYIVLRVAGFVAKWIPPRWGKGIARWAGRVIYRISPVADASRDNARHVLGRGAGPERVSRVAQRAFENRVLNIYEMLWLPHRPLKEIGACTQIAGREHVDELVRCGRGALLVSAHVGPTEFMIQALTAFNYPMIGVIEHLEPERLLQYMMDLRGSHGLQLVSTHTSFIDIYRRVKRGEFLLSMVDRDSTGTGQIVDLFGEPAWVPDGYARLAVRADVPVVYGTCVRTAEGATAKLCQPIYPDRSLGREEAVLDIIRRTLAHLEEAIRENPGEWHLSTPIWRLAREPLEKGSEM
jgi:KDO2-lipid IV(A) lauroyltransferase